MHGCLNRNSKRERLVRPYRAARVLHLGGEGVVSGQEWGKRLAYCISCSQLLDTLQVCRDFKYGQCVRPACKFVHLLEGNEVTCIRFPSSNFLFITFCSVLGDTAVTYEPHFPRKN